MDVLTLQAHQAQAVTEVLRMLAVALTDEKGNRPNLGLFIVTPDNARAGFAKDEPLSFETMRLALILSEERHRTRSYFRQDGHTGAMTDMRKLQ